MGAAVVGPKEETPRAKGGGGLEAEERADIKLDELGMFDFINSAYERAEHSFNARATAVSSSLRSRRASGKHEESLRSKVFRL